MCLAVPGQIEEITARKGIVNVASVRVEALLDVVPEAKVGDWVLVHAGVAITVLDDDEARETCDLFRQAEGE